MTWILIGAVFAVLNFNVPFGAGAIGVLPDTLGYILILLGMISMEKQVSIFLIILGRVNGLRLCWRLCVPWIMYGSSRAGPWADWRL